MQQIGNLLNDFDPYELLRVEQTATSADIKNSFKKLTLHYHPDRNTRNPNYDANVYKKICKAYAILKDPRKRRVFDSTYAPQHQDLRDASLNFVSSQSNAPEPKFGARGNFSKGDLRDFNSQFERKRAVDPNDRGYGDKMLPRMSMEQMQKGGGRDNVQIGSDLFEGRKVDSKTFNEMFDNQYSSDSPHGSAMIDASECEPMGFGIQGSSDFTDVAVYDGLVIVGKETSDFGQGDMGSGLNYSDYQKGFTNYISSHVANFDDSRINKGDFEKKLNERVAEYSRPVSTNNVSKQEKNRQFQDQLSLFEQQKEMEYKRESDENKKLVFKYKDQYPEHLLTSLNRQTQPQPTDEQRPHIRSELGTKEYAEEYGTYAQQRNDRYPRQGQVYPGQGQGQGQNQQHIGHIGRQELRQMQRQPQRHHQPLPQRGDRLDTGIIPNAQANAQANAANAMSGGPRGANDMRMGIATRGGKKDEPQRNFSDFMDQRMRF